MDVRPFASGRTSVSHGLIARPHTPSTAMSTVLTIKLPEQTKRSPMVVAIQKRHGHGQAPMKDRRAPRGGSRNRQRDYRDERY